MLMTTLFGLDASDIGDIAREAFHDCNDVGGPHWPTVGAKIMADLLHADRTERIAKEMAPAAVEARKAEHANLMLAHLSAEKRP